MWQTLAKMMTQKAMAQGMKQGMRNTIASKAMKPIQSAMLQHGLGGGEGVDVGEQVKSQFIDSSQPIQEAQNFPYKLKAGLAVNLGMPMDTFMSTNDFKRTGTAMPNRNDPNTGIINSLRNYYGGGFGR